MAMENTRFSDHRTGHVINDEETAMNGFVGDIHFFGSGNNFPGTETFQLSDLQIFEEEGMQLAIHEPTAVGVPKRLFMVDEAYLYVYNIAADGIHEVGHYTGAGSNNGPYMLNYQDCHFGAGIDRPFSGALTTGENAAHEVLLAFTRSYLDDDQASFEPTYTTYLCKVLANGQVQFTHKIATLSTIPSGTEGFNVPSLVFSPNGEYLYYTQSTAPYVGVINLSNTGYTDLGATLSIQNPSQLGYGNLYLDKSPTSNEPVLYLIAPQRQGYLTGIDDPANLTWSNSIPATGAINNAPTSIWAAEQGDTYALPDVHNRNERQIQNWQQADLDQTCCLPHASMVTSHVASITGTNTWTATNNPFGNVDEVIFMNDLVIEAGATVYVTGMRWRFGPNAKLIIRASGYARFTSSELTGLSCEGYRWPGVRVEGNKDALQTTAFQGKIWLSNSTVSNARIGVRCAKELPGTVNVYGYNGPLNASGYGGIIWTSNSTFRNCLTGVDVGDYSHSPGSLTINDNVSFFQGTHFVTEFPLPDMVVPLNHLYVHGTRKVSITGCSFANDAPGFFPVEQWGTGIKVNAAEITVQGYTNPNSSYVRNLRTGIDRMNCIKLPITVEGMRFSGNLKGIQDHACYYGWYTNNTFNVPDQGTDPSHRYGIELDQSRFFTIERNTFTGGSNRDRSTGIWFKGINAGNDEYVYDNERIYDNDFAELQHGCLVNDVHRSYDGGENDNGLEIFCGYYNHNIADIAMADHSIIRPNQFVEDPPQLAGNYFNDLANCSSDYDWDLDPDWDHGVGPYENMTITYLRNEDDHTKAFCPTLAQHFVDLQSQSSGLFNENVHCANGVLDLHHTHAQAESAYRDARGLCIAAKNLLDGHTDGGERPDLIAELEQDDPWLSTGFLRDRLMLNSPLSNEVLRAMIRRGQPMDQWHITQVCLQNSRLDPGILGQLRTSGILNEFFMNVVMQAQTGTGLTAKQLLEKEWMLRRAQQAQALAEAGWFWGTDTINPGSSNDSLLAALETDGGLDHRWSRMAMRLIDGDMAGAADLLSSFGKYQSGRDQLEAVIGIGTAHNGDWSLLTGGEVELMVTYAESGIQGAAVYAGLLDAYNLADVDVQARFPNHQKSMRWNNEEDVEVGKLIAITAYPTPADEATMLTFPAELSGEAFRIEDVQGRVVYQGRFESAGVQHLHTSDLPSGMYGILVQGSTISGRLLVEH
jgi:hypothetical protein